MLNFLILALNFAATLAQIPENFVNDNIHRTIDLSTNVVRENRAIAFVATSGKKVPAGSEYFLAVELAGNMSVSFISAKEKAEKSEKTLRITKVEKLMQKNNRIVALWKVAVENPEVRNIIIFDITYVNGLAPFPKEIAQNERHLVEFFGNVFTPSPYVTKKQKLKVILASTSVITHSQTPEPVSKAGKTITYGPYESKDVAPFTLSPLHVHYENNHPFLTISSLSRQIWISHWGSNMAVEEWYEARNDAAKLKNEFSRIDFSHNAMNHGKTSVVKQFMINLPAGVSDPYYRDDVGNVSTSSFKLERDASFLELRPRFPLFGGWVYSWHHGYNLDLKDYVKVKDNGKYIFQAPFTQSISNAPIENFELKIILPEGAQNVDVEIPFGIDSKEWSRTFTYVDTTGRPTLIIRKKNVVDEHNVPFQISYEYGSHNNFTKPIVLSLGYFVIFVVSMIYWRVDISYGTHHQKSQ